MANEAKDIEEATRLPEIKPVILQEAPVASETSATKEPAEKTEQKLEQLTAELPKSKPETPNQTTPTISISESGAQYGEKYASIAESRFNKGPLAKHGEAIIAEAKKLEIPNGISILEVGCNTGMLMEQLQENLKDKSPKIAGVDFNRDAVAIAKAKGFDANFADAQVLENIPNDSVDLIFSLHTYEHVPDLGKAFAALQRVLRPGGKAYIIVPPNMYGLETVRVAAEDLPEDKKGKGPFGGIKTFFNAWSYARKLHCSNLGGPFGGARSHAEKILKNNQIDLKVYGGMRSDLALANLLVFEKPTSQTF